MIRGYLIIQVEYNKDSVMRMSMMFMINHYFKIDLRLVYIRVLKKQKMKISIWEEVSRLNSKKVMIFLGWIHLSLIL